MPIPLTMFDPSLQSNVGFAAPSYAAGGMLTGAQGALARPTVGSTPATVVSPGGFSLGGLLSGMNPMPFLTSLLGGRQQQLASTPPTSGNAPAGPSAQAAAASTSQPKTPISNQNLDRAMLLGTLGQMLAPNPQLQQAGQLVTGMANNTAYTQALQQLFQQGQGGFGQQGNPQ